MGLLANGQQAHIAQAKTTRTLAPGDSETVSVPWTAPPQQQSVQVKAINFTGQDFGELHDKGRHDVYRMMITGFSHSLVSGFYIVSMGLLCLHLSHGDGAMFQSLGLKNEVYGPRIDRCAKITACLIFLGYISIPLAVLLGYGREALR